MSKTTSIVVMAASAVAASAIFAVITLANPPAGTPGTTYGILAVNNNNIGVSTTTPATKLDVNGSTTIRGWLDMTGNTIKNLAIPATTTDAVSKAYADAPGKVWGEGRPGALILNAAGTGVAGNASDAGECTVNRVRVGRSSTGAAWGSVGSACPANWWVCSAAERGTSACGTAQQTNMLICRPGQDTVNLFNWQYVTTTWAWVADPSTSAQNTSSGRYANTFGTFINGFSCSIWPVWCCK